MDPWDTPNDINDEDDTVETQHTIINIPEIKQLHHNSAPLKSTIPPQPECQEETPPLRAPSTTGEPGRTDSVDPTGEPVVAAPVDNDQLSEQPPVKKPRRTNTQILQESTQKYFVNDDRPCYIDPATAAQNLGVPNPDTQPRRRITRSAFQAQTDFNNRSRPVVQDRFRLDDPPILPDETNQPPTTMANQSEPTAQNMFTLAVASLDAIDSENNQYFRQLVRNEPYYGLCPLTCVTEHKSDMGDITFEQQQVKREAYIDWMFNNQEPQ